VATYLAGSNVQAGVCDHSVVKDNQWFIYDGPNFVYRQFAVQVNTFTKAQQADFNTQDNGVLYLYGPIGLIMEFDRFSSAGTNDTGRTFLYDP
jgi:hypothetical protein